MIYVTVAFIVFYDEKNRILMQDRTGISRYGEEWNFFGRQVEEGESPKEGLLREIKEELTYDLKDYEFVSKRTNKSLKGYIGTEYMYASPLGNKLDLFDQKEGDDMKLFSIEEAKKLKLFTGHEKLLEDIENYLEKKNG